jgi:hypothetical protein
MSKAPTISEVQKEVSRLQLRIALLRYELREAITKEIPLGFLKNTMQEICILQEQKLLLQQGNFHLLPYSIKLLYS